MIQLAKQSSVREEKVSITVKDYNKFLRVTEKDNSIIPHADRLYKNEDQNVFVYKKELKLWLDEQKIDYRINWEVSSKNMLYA